MIKEKLMAGGLVIKMVLCGISRSSKYHFFDFLKFDFYRIGDSALLKH
jgi:hypothetical protein